MKLLRTSFIGSALLAGAAAMSYNSDADRLAKSEKAVAGACHKLSGMTDEQAFKCVSETWNHAALVSNLVQKNTLFLPVVREACTDKALPNAKFEQGITSALKKDTASCFDAIDRSLNVAEQTKSDEYKQIATDARHATERAHTFLPSRF